MSHESLTPDTIEHARQLLGIGSSFPRDAFFFFFGELTGFFVIQPIVEWRRKKRGEGKD